MSLNSADDNTSFIKTKSSQAKQENAPKFEEVVFTQYKSKKSDKLNSKQEPSKRLRDTVRSVSKPKDERRTFMKKARFDIIKFGMTGFDAKKKEETKQALAISLGAFPKKRKPINYKELKEQRKIQNELEKERKEASGNVMNRAPSTKTAGRNQSNTLRQLKQKEGILGVYGKVNKKEVLKK